MKNSKVVKGYLGLAGLMFLMIGVMILFNLFESKMNQGVDIGTEINMLNDVRGLGGLFIRLGITVLAGIFLSRLRFTSIILAIVVMLSFGVGRAISVMMDGIPADGLVKTTVAEFAIALIGLVIFFKYKE
jgi:hypothetical protein